MQVTRTFFVILSTLSVVLPASGEDTNNAELLSGRIAHSDPSMYSTASSVHGGAGKLHYQGLLSRPAMNTNFIFLDCGVIPPKGGIGHHFHHKMEEMYVILDNEAEFTINGRTSLLQGPAGVPCKMGQSHAIYNPTDKPAGWLNFAVSSVKRNYDNFDLNDDRVGASLDEPPVFVAATFDRSLLQPVDRYHGGTGTVHYRRALAPAVFSTPWAFVDHLIIPPESGVGTRQHANIEEIYYIVRGAGSITIDGRSAAIRKGDAFYTLLNESYSITNNSTGDLELLIVGVAMDKDQLQP
ncbi:MAG: cupin domain-containing protein [Fuerstiella sp.]|nr:cupin domain-containing protein [Fuerstiella sp.]